MDTINADMFCLYDYRIYDGFHKKKSYKLSNSNYFCVGTCDLYSMSPVNLEVFNWYEHLNLHFKSDLYGFIRPIESLINVIEDYIVHYNFSGTVCLVIPIIGKEVILSNNKKLGITKNSHRVIKYLEYKKIISSSEAQLYYSIINDLSIMSQEDCIKYTVDNLSKLEFVMNKYNINLIWTTNATKTANNYYRPIINSILNNTNLSKNYVGWVENIDLLPDSSIGHLTQLSIFEKFYDKIISTS